MMNPAIKPADNPALARYHRQLLHYRDAVRKLWPQRRVHAGLVLTRSAQWVEMPV